MVEIVSLHSGTDGPELDVPELGSRRLGPRTLLALRGRARKADIVVAYGSATLPACAVALVGTGVPFLYRNISDPTHWLRGPLHRLVTRAQYRRTAGVVALWPGAADSLVRHLGVDPDRVVVIPNARDPDEFRPPTDDERLAARERYGLGDGPVVAFIGAASPEKRLDLAIDALANLPRHTLMAAGGGAGVQEAQRRAEQVLGGRAVFVGELDDVRPVLHASDVVLIPSDVEGMPGVAIEAELSGLAVVGTAVGAMPSMPWVLTAEATPDRLAAAITEATRSPHTADPSCGDYTWPQVAARWDHLLRWFVGQ
jgi:glycosyltransferase involved in cell wall biosynthesis